MGRARKVLIAVISLTTVACVAGHAKADDAYRLAVQCGQDPVCSAYDYAMTDRRITMGYLFIDKLSKLHLSPEQQKAVIAAFDAAVKEATERGDRP